MNIALDFINGISVGIEFPDKEQMELAGDKWAFIVDLFIIRCVIYWPE